MSWEVTYLPEVEKDFQKITKRQTVDVLKTIDRVSENPLPVSEGGYGKPLGHKRGRTLTGFLKIKLKKDGLRVVYRLIRNDKVMNVIVIGIREDEEVYEITKTARKSTTFFDIVRD